MAQWVKDLALSRVTAVACVQSLAQGLSTCCGCSQKREREREKAILSTLQDRQTEDRMLSETGQEQKAKHHKILLIGSI